MQLQTSRRINYIMKILEFFFKRIGPEHIIWTVRTHILLSFPIVYPTNFHCSDGSLTYIFITSVRGWKGKVNHYNTGVATSRSALEWTFAQTATCHGPQQTCRGKWNYYWKKAGFLKSSPEFKFCWYKGHTCYKDRDAMYIYFILTTA